MTDETDRPGGARRGTRMAVIGATVALGLAGLGVAASGAFADGGGSSGGASAGSTPTAYTQAQDATPQQQPQAPGTGDCPGMGQGGAQGGSGSGSSSQGSATTPS